MIVLLNKPAPLYSETFIADHVRYLRGSIVNIFEYMPRTNAGRNPRLTVAWYDLRRRYKIRQLHRYLLKRQIPILIEYGTTAARALPALLNLNQKIVVHFHGYDVHSQKIVRQFESSYRELFQIANALVVVSHKMRQALISLGAPEDKIHHIACGVDSRIFLQADVRKSQPVFFACGRFVEKKAPHFTIEAFFQAWKVLPFIRLRMAGDGPLLARCEALVHKLGISEAVSFLGVLDHVSVARELGKSRAFIQHSLTAADGDSEGTPVGILEAGCCGLPVISTIHAGIPEVVQNGVTGLLCAEGDVDAMADAIIKLARDPIHAAELGMRARKVIMKDHTVEISISRLRALL